VRANPDIQFAMVMDPAGTAIVAERPQVMGKNFKFREYFKEAMQGRPHMTASSSAPWPARRESSIRARCSAPTARP